MKSPLRQLLLPATDPPAAEHPAAGRPGRRGARAGRVEAQYRALTALRPAPADECRAIGLSCSDNEQGRAAYEAIAPGLAAYQRDVVEGYAASRLAQVTSGGSATGSAVLPRTPLVRD
ncbi:hypothetical protein [Streptomyces sp. NPDC048142]|uniref:hypothetical protein n=1 Tax=Streptomyces sp. NPDC048142 TaxID=3365501 RepID=UPI0037177541